MLFSTLLASLGLASLCSATGVLLPLYVYPSATFGDGAANWNPVFSAITTYPSVPWLIVINPGNGPGPTLQPGNNDRNYIDGVTRLNSFPSVANIGYVRTNFGTSPMAELQTNITAWKNWDTYAPSNISVQGIFFDETAASNVPYLRNATAFAKQAFGRPITTICNFGVAVPDELYNVCDVVIAFESCLNCALGPQYRSQETITNNIPQARRAKAGIIVNEFTGSAFDGRPASVSLLEEYENVIQANGVGWSYFVSGGYHTITTAPATVGENARNLAS